MSWTCRRVIMLYLPHRRYRVLHNQNNFIIRHPRFTLASPFLPPPPLFQPFFQLLSTSFNFFQLFFQPPVHSHIFLYHPRIYSTLIFHSFCPVWILPWDLTSLFPLFLSLSLSLSLSLYFFFLLLSFFVSFCFFFHSLFLFVSFICSFFSFLHSSLFSFFLLFSPLLFFIFQFIYPSFLSTFIPA